MQLPAPSGSKPPSNEEDEPLELARFRQEWLEELKKKKVATGSGSTVPNTENSGSSVKGHIVQAEVPQTYPGPSTQTISGSPSALTYVSPASILASKPLPPHLSSALNIYRRAVEHEQRSELDDALLLYRQAFRMDPNVDRAYHRDEMLASILSAQKGDIEKTDATPGDANNGVDLLTKKLSDTLVLKPLGIDMAGSIITGTLATLISGFPVILTFEPEIEEEPVHLRKLPDEVIVMVLRRLDHTSIERFAVVNRRARILTLDSTIWRDMVVTTYKPPQVPDIESMLSVIESGLSDFRRIYVEHPRVRMDGVYIATCHYVRNGLSENSWVNISHLITYHRYLRFFPNGEVLSLLANEEHSPQQVIPLLKPTLRMKGLFIGNWHLSEAKIHLTNLSDASLFPIPTTLSPSSSREPRSHLHSSGNARDSSDRTRYTFTMVLDLHSRPLGRWNKLTMESYDSINLETGDMSPVVLKSERPFWFSKVRSYTTY